MTQVLRQSVHRMITMLHGCDRCVAVAWVLLPSVWNGQEQASREGSVSQSLGRACHDERISGFKARSGGRRMLACTH
jgi:hypothetical protein